MVVLLDLLVLKKVAYLVMRLECISVVYLEMKWGVRMAEWWAASMVAKWDWWVLKRADTTAVY